MTLGNLDWVDDLNDRFLSLGGASSEFFELVLRYGAPGRHYHTLGHIRDVVAAMDQWYPDSPDWLLFAAFYHDVIYDPTRHDNEVASGRFALDRQAHLLGPNVVDMVRAIEMTAGHDLATLDARDMPLLVGDLIGMAAPVEQYRENTARIRAEYSVFSGAEWAAGRRAFIIKYYARRTLPNETRFDAAEQRIHANMLDELSRLDLSQAL